jgi:hypothetical protein
MADLEGTQSRRGIEDVLSDDSALPEKFQT